MKYEALVVCYWVVAATPPSPQLYAVYWQRVIALAVVAVANANASAPPHLAALHGCMLAAYY